MRRNLVMLGTLSVSLLACALPRPGAAQAPDAASARAYVDAMAHEHAGHTAVSNGASRQEPRQEVRTQDVEYGTVLGKAARGYMAWPAAGGRNLPAVIMVHEWWGLNDNIKSMARQLAGEGYRVLAVDMYGRTATTPQEARQYMGEIMQNSARGAAHMRAAAAYLAERQRAPKIGVTGFCFGGAWALQSAIFMPEQVDAAVVYYGRVVGDRDQLSQIDAPLLGHFGSADRSIPVENVRQMEETLKELGKDVTIHVYEGAAHAFANPTGGAYNEAAASEAWVRTTDFFARHLKAAPAAAR